VPECSHSILKICSEVARLPEEARYAWRHAGDSRRNDWLSSLAHQSDMDRLGVVPNMRVIDVWRLPLVQGRIRFRYRDCHLFQLHLELRLLRSSDWWSDHHKFPRVGTFGSSSIVSFVSRLSHIIILILLY